MDYPKYNEFRDGIKPLMDVIGKSYWFPLSKYLRENPALIKTFPSFLLKHDKIVIYCGKTHLAIEYFGKETTTDLPEKMQWKIISHDYSIKEENFFDLIIGFKYDGTLDFRLPMPAYSDDWVLPTNAGHDKLIELNWNFAAQNSIMGINTSGFYVPEGRFCRIVNGRFFDADETGLKTRHIKWIDFLPLQFDSTSDDKYDTFVFDVGPLSQLVEHDAKFRYPLPSKEDFKYSKLPQLNRFIELIASPNTNEPDITSFLEQDENKFILSMGFLAKEIHPQIECEWQSETKPNIKPDFFVVRPNGFADIVEFKLPSLKSQTVVGQINRETFSAEINAYISQTRTYRQYFEDPNNRTWTEANRNIKVHYPKRILVIGRRWDFSHDEWKVIINDYKDIEILTYDDIIDGVTAQFYM